MFRSWEKDKIDCLPESSVKLLERTLKCKSYFMEQSKLSLEDMTIPTWYHACKRENLINIIEGGCLKVQRKMGWEQGYTGAWVSSFFEPRLFGRYGVTFSQKLENLDNNSRLSHLYHYKRWRGFLENIPLNFAKIYVIRQNHNKECQKEEKKFIDKRLTSSNCSSYKIISDRQMIFLERHIRSILGTPNLSPRLWGTRHVMK